MQCNSCSTIFPAKEYLVPYNSETFEANDPLPSCKTCKSVIRPNIMMFGDYEFDNTRCQKQNQVYREFVNRLEKKDLLVVLEFGAGHGVPTIRNLGEQMLASNKCETKLVRINLRDYDPPMYYSKKKEKDFIAIADSALNFTKELEKELN